MNHYIANAANLSKGILERRIPAAKCRIPFTTAFLRYMPHETGSSDRKDLACFQEKRF
jgi:hypothetical protein